MLQSTLLLAGITSLATATFTTMPFTRTVKKTSWEEKHFKAQSTRSHRVKTAKRSVEIGLGSQSRDTAYFLPISVGTPPVQLIIGLDTGSTKFVLGSRGLNTMYQVGLYDPAASTSANVTTIPSGESYIDGSGADGVIVYDQVAIGSYLATGLAITAFTVEHGGFDHLSIDGIMGWLPTSIDSNGKPITSFIGHILLSGQIDDDPEFGLALGNTRNINPTASDTETSGGSLIIGGVDKTLFAGDLNYVDVCPVATNPNKEWMVTMSSVEVNGVSVPTPNLCALIDSGASTISFPAALAKAVYDQIPGAQMNPDNSTYTYPCASPSTVSVALGGVTYTIAAADFAYYTRDGITCQGALSAGSDDAAILGDTFMKSLYVSFKMATGTGLNIASIGFALANAAPTTLGPAPLTNSTLIGANVYVAPGSTAPAAPSNSTLPTLSSTGIMNATTSATTLSNATSTLSNGTAVASLFNSSTLTLPSSDPSIASLLPNNTALANSSSTPYTLTNFNSSMGTGMMPANDNGSTNTNSSAITPVPVVPVPSEADIAAYEAAQDEKYAAAAIADDHAYYNTGG